MKINTKSVFLIVICTVALVYSCASIGTPSGGRKDMLAPVPLYFTPANGSTNFKAKEIEVEFNECIKFKELRKNLIVSPNIDIADHIKPSASMPSKKMVIDLSKIELKPNTTYTINFGNSITDNNEGNELLNFKYVFSTGDKIDSLVVGGVVADAFDEHFDPKTSILMYIVDTAYTDSTVYKEKPAYYARLNDSKDSTFRIDNVTPGTYQLIALVDDNSNMRYDQAKDKIGFFPRTITLDSTSEKDNGYLLRLSLAKPKYKVFQGANLQPGLIQVTMNDFGNRTVERITPDLSEGEKDLFIFSKERDTLQYWFSGEEKDSIVFYVKKDGEVTDTINAKIRKPAKVDFALRTSTSTPNIYENVFIIANKPITAVDSSAVRLITSKDSTAVPFSLKIDSTHFKAEIIFKQKPESQYLLDVYPGAITSILGETVQDTLLRTIKTKTRDDYGNLRITPVSFSQYPLIFQLLSIDMKTVVREVVLRGKDFVTFDLVPPNKYRLRVIYDTNDNGKWDTVDFLNHIQPEKVKYMTDEIEVRAMWSEDIEW
ncbi:MAG: Ig-like domain-containing protein [Flavobacteriales bacterium]|nr:Ig-like domain-containing protein [Flavobacteriales bacterium]